MAIDSRGFARCCVLLLLCCSQVLILTSAAESKRPEISSSTSATPKRDGKGNVVLEKCLNCSGTKKLDDSIDSSSGYASLDQLNEDIDITATYTDASGEVKLHTVKSGDLSSSWVIEKNYEDHVQTNDELRDQVSDKDSISGLRLSHQPPTDQHSTPVDPLKLERRKLREERKQNRTKELIHTNKNVHMQLEAIERSKRFDITGKGKYKMWMREFQKASADKLLKRMKDQIILAKVYSSIARSDEKTLYFCDILDKQIRVCENAIGEANSDGELCKGALSKATAMGNILSKAKEKLHKCGIVARKLRAMVQSTEGQVTTQKKKSLFLMEFVSFSIPKPLHCLSLQLTNDYFLNHHSRTELPNMEKIEDPSLYHYAIFSDNVLSTWVVVNSTVMNAKEPEKHVFHIVTDKLQFPAMQMWFIAHPPLPATVNVESIDEFKWLNSSYCPVLRQLESAKMKEFYFKANHPSKLSGWEERLKYKNPKYLSMLNHIRFYMPELFPKLDKILFLDDDVVVQKDLTPLWSIDMKGMVNGAVETCKRNFHEFNSYLNFSNPEISHNFDPHACGWAFGMNLFDLKEWRRRNLTGVYHYWQDLNEDRRLWSLGTLPPGLITFYKLTYPLDKSWHLLALGYRPGIHTEDIKKAAVIHYNGNNKPWLDLGYACFRGFWAKYVDIVNPYILACNIDFSEQKKC